MSRELTHLVKKGSVEKAIQKGTHVTTLCGYTDTVENVQARYPLGNRGTKPTCILCSIMIARLLTSSQN